MQYLTYECIYYPMIKIDQENWTLNSHLTFVVVNVGFCLAVGVALDNLYCVQMEKLFSTT